MHALESSSHLDLKLEFQQKILWEIRGELLWLQKNIEAEKLPPLNKDDFLKYFAGEDFQQRSIGNCRLLATIDSFVNLRNYEDIIKKSVKRDNKGNFYITLPLWAPKWEIIKVSPEDIKDQININGTRAILVDGKEGIKALVYAYGKYTTGKHYDNFDYHTLWGGWWDRAINTLIYGMESLMGLRNEKANREEDPNGEKDQIFVNNFQRTLELFNPQFDLLTIAVHQTTESNWDRQSFGDNYSTLGHYSKANHLISVESVRKTKDQLIVKVSNPRDSKKSYEISFSDLLKASSSFYLGTSMGRKNIFPNLKPSTSNEKDKRVFHGTKKEGAWSLNKVIQETWGLNKQESLQRGDVVVHEIKPGILWVEWRGRNDSKVILRSKDIGIKIQDKYELKIPRDQISTTLNNQENIKFQSFLYPPRIALFINKMRNLYIDRKNGKTQSPFHLNSKGEMIFIPDLEKFPYHNKVKKQGGIIADNIIDIAGIVNKKIKSDRYEDDRRSITVLKNREVLWIKNNNTEIKTKIIDFLNTLYIDK